MSNTRKNCFYLTLETLPAILQAKKAIVRDGVFTGSEFNETIAKTFRDSGPEEKQAVPERIWHFNI